MKVNIKSPLDKKNMNTYLFYDIETTGLNKAFDQILQFAAIRTTLQLEKLDQIEIKIKLNPDVIPSPTALLTHQIPIQSMLEGEPEWTAMQKIHKELNKPGTISLGYNTLGFDDEFLRFSFYRNLLPPYHHQFKNQCSRMDLYPVTLFYLLFKKAILNWPESLKLADLNAANQLSAGRAHEALADVEATLALARIFFDEQPLWNYLQGFFNKATDERRTQALIDGIGIMIDGRSREQNFQMPVLLLGNHKIYKNLVFLRLDTLELSECDSQSLVQQTRIISKKYGEPNFILPLEKNSLPETIVQLTQKNIAWLKQHLNALETLREHHTQYQYPTYPQTDIDAALYINGFWTATEEDFCRNFHRAAEHEKTKLFATISNPRLRALVFRILGRHYPEALSLDQKTIFSEYLERAHSPKEESHTLIDYQGRKKLTRHIALQEAAELRKTELNQTKIDLLNDLEAYLTSK